MIADYFDAAPWWFRPSLHLNPHDTLQTNRIRRCFKASTKPGFKIIDDDELLPTFLALTIHRAGGFYIDVGCSGLIAAGKIHHKFGHEITQFNKNSVTFADGEEMEADEVVFATGYANGRTRTRRIFGDSVADRIEQIWGFDKQGEIRGVWRRSGHEDFWVAAGSLWLSRYYSRLLALQIKMIEEGLVEV
jgi:hypothetical protein